MASTHEKIGRSRPGAKGPNTTTVEILSQQVDFIEAEAPAFNRDEAELALYGKKPVLRRTFGMISIIGMTCTLMATWEGIFILLGQGLTNGGPLGLICQYLFAWAGVTTQVLVMAEMASMIPLAGGQYNWVAILAPPQHARFLSYIAGWVTVIAWQAGLAGNVYLVGTLIEGMAIMTHPAYVPKQWHTFLMFYGVIFVALFINTILARLLPQLESWVLVLHVLGFVAVIIPLSYLGEKASAKDVFQTFIDGGGWGAKGLTFFVGINTTMSCMLGVDGATHMAEEVEGASRVLPRAMISSLLINVVAGFGGLVAILFSMTDVEGALASPTGYPFMYVFEKTVGSSKGAEGMVIVPVLALVFATIGALTTASRMLWAFAREKAVPGHSWIAKIHGKQRLPLASIAVTTIVSCLLALVSLGSTAAFNAFISLGVAGFYSSFTFAACCGLWRRLYNKPMRFGPFKIHHRIDIPVRIYAVSYSLLGIFWSFWPQTPDPTLRSMNWAVAVFFGTMILSVVYWFAAGSKHYKGPIIETSLDEYRRNLRTRYYRS